MNSQPNDRQTERPNEEQMAALRAFKTKYGRDWFRRLNDAWLDGKDVNEPNGHLLRQVRNRYYMWVNENRNSI